MFLTLCFNKINFNIIKTTAKGQSSICPHMGMNQRKTTVRWKIEARRDGISKDCFVICQRRGALSTVYRSFFWQSSARVQPRVFDRRQTTAVLLSSRRRVNVHLAPWRSDDIKMKFSPLLSLLLTPWERDSETERAEGREWFSFWRAARLADFALSSSPKRTETKAWVPNRGRR